MTLPGVWVKAMTEIEDTTDEAKRPDWTEQQKLDAYKAIEKAVNAKCKARQEDWRQDVIQDAFKRWLGESRNGSVTMYVRFAIADKSSERNYVSLDEETVGESASGGTLDASLEDRNIEAKENLDKAIGKRADATAHISVQGEGHLQRVDPEALTPEGLLSDLAALASRAALVNNGHPTDTTTQQLVAVLCAARESAAAGDGQLDELGKLARKYLAERNRGPRTKEQELVALRNACSGPPDAERVLRRLRVSPQILPDLVDPGVLGAWDSPERISAQQTVGEALLATISNSKEANPSARARAVLVALGMPKARAKVLFDFERKRAVRSRADNT